MKPPRPILSLVLAIAFGLLAPATGGAKDKRVYQKGVLLQVDSTPCGMQQDSSQGFAGAVLGTDSEKKKTREMLCQEYTLRSERLAFRIRPKDEKKPVLLPVGETVEFRIHKEKLLLRVPEKDGKEREYIVISMTLRKEIDGPDPCSAKK
jgi:hypothetical protein